MLEIKITSKVRPRKRKVTEGMTQEPGKRSVSQKVREENVSRKVSTTSVVLAQKG